MTYVGTDNREYEDPEMDAMVQDAISAQKEAKQDWPSTWPKLEFNLGQMAWLRSDPREAHRIAGVDQVEGWADEDDNWVEASWMYRLDNSRGGWFSAEVLVDRAGHPACLQDFLQREAAKAATNDYDPFLDTDDLP